MTLWMGDILHGCAGAAAPSPALWCRSSLGQRDGWEDSFWTPKRLFKLFRTELSIWKLWRTPAGFRERLLEAEGCGGAGES